MKLAISTNKTRSNILWRSVRYSCRMEAGKFYFADGKASLDPMLNINKTKVNKTRNRTGIHCILKRTLNYPIYSLEEYLMSMTLLSTIHVIFQRTYIALMLSVRLVSNERNCFPLFVKPRTSEPEATKIFSWSVFRAPPSSSLAIFSPGKVLNTGLKKKKNNILSHYKTQHSAILNLGWVSGDGFLLVCF